MTAHQQNLLSFTSILSVLSIVFYCAGFLRVEFELQEHEKRIYTQESESEFKSTRDHVMMTKAITTGKINFCYATAVTRMINLVLCYVFFRF